GQIQALSGGSGLLGLLLQLQGDLNSESGLNAESLGNLQRLSGTLTAISQLQATLRNLQGLGGTIEVSSNVAASLLELEMGLSGTMPSVSTLLAELSGSSSVEKGYLVVDLVRLRDTLEATVQLRDALVRLRQEDN